MKLKETDTRILLGLKAGESPDLIAQRLKLPKSTMYYHLGKLKKMGMIGGVKVMLNYGQIKDEKGAFILISLNKTDNKSLQLFEEDVKKSHVVSDIYALSGGWDYVLMVHGKEEEIRTFLLDRVQAIPNVAKTNSLFILKHIEL
jgi:DNA-binding Lrp family transcriptional regulator